MLSSSRVFLLIIVVSHGFLFLLGLSVEWFRCRRNGPHPGSSSIYYVPDDDISSGPPASSDVHLSLSHFIHLFGPIFQTRSSWLGKRRLNSILLTDYYHPPMESHLQRPCSRELDVLCLKLPYECLELLWRRVWWWWWRRRWWWQCRVLALCPCK